MSERGPIAVRKATTIFRGLFAAVVVLGLVAIGIGVAGFLGVPVGKDGKEQASTVELVVAIVVGLGMIPFGISALRSARIELDDEAFQYLRFGVWCTLASVPLRHITRHGVGEERHGYQRYHVLLLELVDGGKRSVRISMYENWRSFVEQLGAVLEQDQAGTKTSMLGAAFEEKGKP